MKKQFVKIVKRSPAASSAPLTEVVSIGSHTGLSKAIRSWVDEFRQRSTRESLRAFDSLFKD